MDDAQGELSLQEGSRDASVLHPSVSVGSVANGGGPFYVSYALNLSLCFCFCLYILLFLSMHVPGERRKPSAVALPACSHLAHSNGTHKIYELSSSAAASGRRCPTSARGH